MSAKILEGNVLETLKDLPACSVQCVVTSPPYYGLRDYGVDGQIGNEKTIDEYINNLVDVFSLVYKVLRDDGVLFINIGDSYAKDKNIYGAPWRLAFALQSEGWILRQDIIWSKPYSMPESVTDRFVKSHEYIFMLVKHSDYYFNIDPIREPHLWQIPEVLAVNAQARQAARLHAQKKYHAQDAAREISGKREKRGRYTLGLGEHVLKANELGKNKRSVWEVAPLPNKDIHTAVYPPDLIEPCILAASREGDTILDPFNGSGTTGEVAIKYHRLYIGCEINLDYVSLTKRRLSNVQPVLMQERSLTLPAPDGGDSAPSQALSTPDMFSAIEHEPTPAPRR